MLAGAVAPTLRANAEWARLRIVKVYGKDGIRIMPLSEVQKGILARMKIELDTEVGIRPDKVLCKFCGKILPVKSVGAIPQACVNCPCLSCGKTLSQGTGRRHRPGQHRCRSCASKARSPEKKEELARHAALASASRGPSRSEVFILTIPPDTPTKSVVAQGEAAGLVFSGRLVQKVRAKARTPSVIHPLPTRYA